jgi:hypothetical protein
MGWGGENNVIYTDGYHAASLLSLPEMTTQTLLEYVDGSFSGKSATSATRSALVYTTIGGTVNVYDDASTPPLTEPIQSYTGASQGRVTVLNGAVVAVMQDVSAGTFKLNGGAETLIHPYDATKVDLLLIGVAASDDRIHVLYRYWDADAGTLKYTVLTFDATAEDIEM